MHAFSGVIFLFYGIVWIQCKGLVPSTPAYLEQSPLLQNGEDACGQKQPRLALLSTKDSAAVINSYRERDTGLYPPHSNCSWTVRAPPGEKVKLHFTEFEVEPSMDCGMDVLLVYQGQEKTPKAVLCGRVQPDDFISEGNELRLFFYSDNVRQFRGFQIICSVHHVQESCKAKELVCRNGNCAAQRTLCDQNDDCRDGTDEEHCSYKPKKTKCGKPVIKADLSSERIVGGSPSVPGSWPWQVSLRLTKEEPYGHRCGGSIIDHLWIVSVAHCFNSERDETAWTVVVGKYNKIETDQTERTRYIDKLIIHPEYVSPFNLSKGGATETVQRKEHDIALIKLSSPLIMDDNVQPVCLADFKATKKGLAFRVTGWGETLGTGHETVLKQAIVPLVPHATCQRFYRNRYQITDNMVCAGYESGGIDACKGDSGGPLVTQKGKTWYLTGIVSFGGDCGQPNQPGVYTNVYYYVKWIEKTIKRNG